MFTMIKRICVLSVLCGAVMALTPEGGVKRMMSVLCAVILATSLLTAFQSLDYDAYALELSRYREREKTFTEENMDIQQRLNRLVIEDEYETYILDKARTMGADLETVDIQVQWNMDGLWVPYSVSITYRGEERQRDIMEDLISGDLGIPKERQYWSCDDGWKEDSREA